VRPSDSDSGRAWLQNFKPEDRLTAARLLNSLRIVGESTFRTELHALLLSIIDRQVHPVALYAVTDTPKKWSTGEPFPPPLTEPDSSGLVANLLRSVAQSIPDVLLQPSLEVLRSEKVRTALLVDDYSGSSGQALRYLERWERNRTIRSWRSYKLLNLVYVTHAASTVAVERLAAATDRIGIEQVWAGLDFESARWTSTEREEIRDLCRRYAKNRATALGFRRSEGLYLTQHTVPNNLPAVLTQSEGRGGAPWVPMFKNRQWTPEQQRQLLDYQPIRDGTQLLKALGQRPLAQRGSADAEEILLLLAILGSGVRKDGAAAAALAVPVQRVSELVAAALALGLCDPKRRLTDLGRAELRAAKVADRRVFALEGNDAPYFPQYQLGSSARGSEIV